MKLIVVLLLFASSAWGELNRTYPTSAVTNLRMEVYVDVFKTIYNSTYSVAYSTHDWDNTSFHLINQILDESVEKYLVLPSTYIPEGITWKGYCSEESGGVVVPIRCP